MKKLLILLFSIILLSSCTENVRAKPFNGKAILNAPCNQKVDNITWKGHALWYSTTPMENDYKPQTHKFSEEPSFGMLGGTYLIIESRCK